MKTLDRYILSSFLGQAALWFVIMISLRVATDLFINIDEYAKQDKSFVQLAPEVIELYAYRCLAYISELGGVVIVAAAAFTLGRMNKSNELVAMLASGVSLHNVILPILIGAMGLNLLIVLDREMIMPRYAHVLSRDRDDPMGVEEFEIRLVTDVRNNVWYSPRFRPAHAQMDSPMVLVRDNQSNPLAFVCEGVYGCPGDGGKEWIMPTARLIRKGRDACDVRKIHTRMSPVVLGSLLTQQGNDAMAVEDTQDGLQIKAERFDAAGATLIRPRFDYYQGQDTDELRLAAGRPPGKHIGGFVADSAVWRTDEQGNAFWELTNGFFRLPSDLTCEDLVSRHTGKWLDYLSIRQITRLLRLNRMLDPSSAMLVRHVRITDPINNIIMLLLGLPFILSRERNIKASISLCVLTIGMFYAFIYICRYMGLQPEWAAWLPVLLFGPVAIVMLDSVKT